MDRDRLDAGLERARAAHRQHRYDVVYDVLRPLSDEGLVPTDELVLLADAQTSGGLLVVGELPGHPVVGEIVERREHALVVR